MNLVEDELAYTVIRKDGGHGGLATKRGLINELKRHTTNSFTVLKRWD